MARYELDEKEVNALLELIDAGVRAGGLKVANNALVLATKLSIGLQKPIIQEDKKEVKE
jgi:hypothetical protein